MGSLVTLHEQQFGRGDPGGSARVHEAQRVPFESCQSCAGVLLALIGKHRSGWG